MSSTGRASDRQPDDFYETPAWATDAILPHLNLAGSILEPAAGRGAIVQRLVAAGVRQNQLCLNELDPERARICLANTGVLTADADFVAPVPELSFSGCFDLVITNPPYALAEQFILRARQIAGRGGEVAMLLRVNFLSGLKRRKFWEGNPAHVFVLPKRPSFCKIVRDVFQCARCKRKWKVPHDAGPFAVPVDDQCECGEIPVFKTTLETANDSCEYGWFVWGPYREQRWDVLELPEALLTKRKKKGGGDAGIHRAGNGRVSGNVQQPEG